LKTIELYETAEDYDINIFAYNLPENKSLSIETENFEYFIGIDEKRMDNSAELRTALAHELGHCVQGAFYNRGSKGDLICKHEYKADKWAISQLMPKEEMLNAMKHGYVEVWQLAEYFNVTEDLVRKALWIYFDKEC
jgi:Zn-dependent peptidase ImmA (M78 family)